MTYSDGTNSGFSRRNHYVGQPAVKVGSSNFDYYRKPEKSHGFAKRVAFFAYFPLLILWLETDLKIASGFDVLGGFAFTFLFTIVLSAVLVLLCSFSKRRGVNRGIATVLTAVLTIWYGVQMIYYNVFGTITKSKLILLFLHGRKTTVIISQKHRDVKCPRNIITHLHGDFKCFFKLFCKKYEKI